MASEQSPPPAAHKKNPLGPTGETVRHNVRRLRLHQELGYAELARRLNAGGRPIPVLGLRRIEEGTRRVDTDDLVALAVALEVNPNTLLFPGTFTHGVEVEVTGLGWVIPQDLWPWAKGDRWAGAVTVKLPSSGEKGAEVGRQMYRARQLAHELADEEFRYRIDPNLVDDAGPNVRSVSSRLPVRRGDS